MEMPKLKFQIRTIKGTKFLLSLPPHRFPSHLSMMMISGWRSWFSLIPWYSNMLKKGIQQNHLIRHSHTEIYSTFLHYLRYKNQFKAKKKKQNKTKQKNQREKQKQQLKKET
jgi:hypothetical protein